MSKLLCSWGGCQEEGYALSLEVRPTKETEPYFEAETVLCPEHYSLLKSLAQSIDDGSGGEQWHWDAFTVYPE